MQTRRQFSTSLLAAATAAIAGCKSEPRNSQSDATQPVPVILDTDIGDDIDDTWALLMLLRMPQLDLRLAVGDYGNAIYRGRLLAKLLHTTGRTDVPVGIGVDPQDNAGQQSAWIGDYTLDDYPGEIIDDGVQALIDTVLNSPRPVTLLCIGPVPNVAEALRREPAIADNARIVGMYGSIYEGYDPGSEPAPEWNVKVDPASLQALFAAPWDITITPLDTCGRVKLDGADFRRLYESGDPWIDTLMENYRIWLPGAPYMDPDTDTTRVSSTLFDTVAVYLAATQDLVDMEELPLRVTDDGYTVIDHQAGRPVRCATSWKDLPGFRRELVEVLLGERLRATM